MGRADRVLDPGEGVAGRMAARRCPGCEIHCDPCGAAGIARRIDAGAAVERIRPGPTIRSDRGAEPIRLSIPATASPAASPPEAAPVARLTVTPAVLSA